MFRCRTSLPVNSPWEGMKISASQCSSKYCSFAEHILSKISLASLTCTKQAHHLSSKCCGICGNSVLNPTPSCTLHMALSKVQFHAYSHTAITNIQHPTKSAYDALLYRKTLPCNNQLLVALSTSKCNRKNAFSNEA